jgi:hypothetical protein
MTGLGRIKSVFAQDGIAPSRPFAPPHQGANNFLVMSGILLHFSDIAAFANVRFAPNSGQNDAGISNLSLAMNCRVRGPIR